MTSALHLEHNMDSLQHLTIHLQRNFKLLRQLENKADGLRQTIIGVLSDDLLPNISKMDVQTRKDKVNTIEGLLDKAKGYEDDKVQLTIHTYELVGKYICRFHSSLANKATSSRAEQEAAAVQETVPIKTRSKRELSVGERVDTETEKGKKTSSRAEQQVAVDQEARPIKTRSKCKSSVDERVETETEKGKRKRKRMSYRDMLDMPVYRYQPTYCLCHQESYGKMIACDNPDCPIEWYHIKCVHVKIIPKGKWYCPKCTQGKDRL